MKALCIKSWYSSSQDRTVLYAFYSIGTHASPTWTEILLLFFRVQYLQTFAGRLHSLSAHCCSLWTSFRFCQNNFQQSQCQSLFPKSHNQTQTLIDCTQKAGIGRQVWWEGCWSSNHHDLNKCKTPSQNTKIKSSSKQKCANIRTDLSHPHTAALVQIFANTQDIFLYLFHPAWTSG